MFDATTYEVGFWDEDTTGAADTVHSLTVQLDEGKAYTLEVFGLEESSAVTSFAPRGPRSGHGRPRDQRALRSRGDGQRRHRGPHWDALLVDDLAYGSSSPSVPLAAGTHVFALDLTDDGAADLECSLTIEESDFIADWITPRYLHVTLMPHATQGVGARLAYRRGPFGDSDAETTLVAECVPAP